MTPETKTPEAGLSCYICVPFGKGPACDACRELSLVERETRLTDTLLIEIEIEEREAKTK